MLIKEGKSINQITDLMLEKYDLDKITMERYLADFVNDLTASNLLEE